MRSVGRGSSENIEIWKTIRVTTTGRRCGWRSRVERGKGTR